MSLLSVYAHLLHYRICQKLYKNIHQVCHLSTPWMNDLTHVTVFYSISERFQMDWQWVEQLWPNSMILEDTGENNNLNE